MFKSSPKAEKQSLWGIVAALLRDQDKNRSKNLIKYLACTPTLSPILGQISVFVPTLHPFT